MDKTFALIMAGGVGTRFWPKSRTKLPKQYLALTGGETMIQAAVRRFRNLLPDDRIFVVTTKEQESLVNEQLPWVGKENIIYEPMGKNTAPCIGLSAIHIQAHDPDAVMIVAPADHLITNTEEYQHVLKNGAKIIRENPSALVTIGIEPTYPATGYGYIQRGEPLQGNHGNAFKVKAFAEKPNLEVAQQFYSSGEFLWNSGTFLWRADTILSELDELMPDLYDSLLKIKSVINKPDLHKVTEIVYKEIFSESIDYGVMEQASNVIVLEGTFGWSDLGSWQEVFKLASKNKDGNVVFGKPILKNVTNSYIETSDRVVAVLGVDNLIVVDTPDALLICDRKHSQDVKWVVENLKHSKRKIIL